MWFLRRRARKLLDYLICCENEGLSRRTLYGGIDYPRVDTGSKLEEGTG